MFVNLTKKFYTVKLKFKRVVILKLDLKHIFKA